MSETNNHNSKKKNKPKTPSQWSEYLNIQTLQMFPANDEFFHRYAAKLVKWAKENDQAFYVEQFINQEDICEDTHYEWVKKHDIVANAHKAALQYLSIRNELFLRKSDPSSVRYIMPQLSKRWLKEDERKAEQKIKIASKQNQNHTLTLSDEQKKLLDF